jgi:hypothetical protein
VSAVVALELDEVEDDDPLEASVSALVAGVAAQLDDVAVESATGALVLSELVCVLSVWVAVAAGLSTACTAMAPPRPSSAATLAAPAARLARRAGCARLRWGPSGISRSFVRGDAIVGERGKRS